MVVARPLAILDSLPRLLAGRLQIGRPQLLEKRIRAALVDVKGIGPWTADIYLLMALRRPDIWPRGDLALKAALRTVKQLAALPSAETFDAIGDAWRPWRVLSLNSGIAATRSLDPQLMQNIFDKLGRRLPYDMAGFLADGKRQMATQNVPDDVREVMERHVEKWPTSPPH